MSKLKQVPRTTERLAQDTIAICHKVHDILGVDCAEHDYQSALALEFQQQGWDFDREAKVLVTYQGEVLSSRKADFGLGGSGPEGLFLEVKAKRKISANDERQARVYASYGDHPLCILVNFGQRPLLEKVFVGRQPPAPRPPRAPTTQVFYATHGADAWKASPPETWREQGLHRRISSKDRPNLRDILLIYRFPASDKRAGICEIYRLKEVEHAYATRWVDQFGNVDQARPPAFGYFVLDMALVARLRKSVSYSQMGAREAVRQWNRWKARFRGITNACGLVPPPVWEALRYLIVSANPEVEKDLRQMGV